MTFSHTLLQWYEENKRQLPWRGEKDPYKIWISEVILQQTRVIQGLAYYHRFVEAFPDVVSLANASQEQVLRLWQGLGYYSRARNLHDSAKYIAEHHHGVFPDNYSEIRALKGVGDYTAAAVSSIAFNLPYPAVDGNVLRVIARIFGIYDNVAQNSTKKIITEKTMHLMPIEVPGLFNQAMMDFGALQCVPQNPDCSQCPFNQQCYAYSYGAVGNLPVIIKQINIKIRYFHYFFYIHNQQIMIEKREQDDIWKNLYQFPMIELSGPDMPNLIPEYTVKHKLTHQSIFAFFYMVSDESLLPMYPAKRLTVSMKEIDCYPFPQVIVRFLDKIYKK